MTYAEAQRWLLSRSSVGITLGTERVAEVLRRLGDPQERYGALHVAGTNGKGSTCAFAAGLLLSAARAARAAGEPAPPIGLYTSPHLLRMTERFQISTQDFSGMEECPAEEFSDAIAAVREAAEPGSRQACIGLSFYEALTAAAFLWFALRKVSIAVVETGLGGRLDATRLCRPLATAVTSIGLDHMELLGSTLPEIAREKAGIFKEHIPAYVACEASDALAVMAAHAAALRAPFTEVPAIPEGVPLALEGAHQRRNAALALALVRHAPQPFHRFLTHLDVVEQGLRATRWPGRLEQMFLAQDGIEVRLDAAHNPEGAEALARWLSSAARCPGVALFGVVADKSVLHMLAPLRLSRQVVVTRPPSPRGRPAEDLARVLRQAGVAVACAREEVAEALGEARHLASRGEMILVYGSIFLIAAVRALLTGEPCDALPLQDPGPARSA